MDWAEQCELFKQMHQGDMGAREKLISGNMGLVFYIAKKYKFHNRIEWHDLASCGFIGLIKAVDTFLFDKGANFGTYASRCIHNEIKMFLRKEISHNFHENCSIYQEKRDKHQELFTSLLKDDSIEDSSELIAKSEAICFLKKVINCKLSRREKSVFDMLYFSHQSNITQEDVAKNLGISQSYVSRLLHRGSKKIIDYIHKNGNDESFL